MKQEMIEMTHIEFEAMLKRLGPEIRRAMTWAIEIIREKAANLELEGKQAYDREKTDLVTDADKAAQVVYAWMFKALFPGVGLIGEEDGLKKPCTIVVDGKLVAIHVTIDPADGTKALARKMSYGVGTMVAVVLGDEIIASYVGDVNTGEIYGFAPGMPPTRTRFAVTTPLEPDTARLLANCYVMLDNIPDYYPDNLARCVKRPAIGGLFKDIDVIGASIGTRAARLWKGEIAAMVLEPCFATPWDVTPVLGMCRKLGFVHIGLNKATGKAEIFDPGILTEVSAEKLPFIVVTHEHYTPQIIAALNA